VAVGARTPVRLTLHAEKQLRERMPEFRDAAFITMARAVAVDVQDARAAGRVAAKCPRRFIRTGTSRRTDARGLSRRESNARYVWTEDDRRLYIVARRRGSLSPGGEKVPVDLVLTAWNPSPNGGQA
jgi:hypothetical protein